EHPGIAGEHAGLGVELLFLKRVALRIDNDGAHSAVVSGLAFREHKAHDGIRDRAVADQIFHTVENELVALAAISAGAFKRIATGIRLGKAKGEDAFAAAAFGEILFLLVLVAVTHDWILPDRSLPGKERPRARAFAVDARQAAGVS